jgi:tetratricopeptide (TPR) repeat protein
MSYAMYDEAIRQYKKAIFFDKENSEIHTFLACTYRSKDDTVQAKLAYQKAIKLNPKNKLALFDLGIMYFKEKNYKAAIEYCNSIIELGPEDQKEIAFNLISYHRSALYMLAVCHKSLNHIVEEKMALQKLLRFYPDDQDAKKKLSELE